MKRFALVAMIVGVIGVIIGSISLFIVITNSSMVKELIGGIDISMASKPLGDPNSKLTLIVFVDYQCAHCANWSLNVKPNLLKNYVENGLIRIYYMDFPFLGKDSFTAAQATYCAEDQGKYWEFQELLFRKQGNVNNGWADRDSMLNFASELGLNTTNFKKCMESNVYADRVKYNKNVGINNKVNATPSFFIIDNTNKTQPVRIVGDMEFEKFNEIITSMLNLH